MVRGRVLIAAAVVLPLLLVAACGEDEGASTESADRENITVGVVEPFPHILLTDFENGLREGAEGADVELRINNANNDPAKEAQIVTDLVTAGVDAILISPLSDESSFAALDQARDAGIEIFGYNACRDDETNKDYLVACVGSDQKELGQLVGEQLASFIGDREVKMAVLNCATFDVCRQRQEGLEGGLGAALSQIDIVADQEAYLLDSATPVVESILTAHPDIDVIFAQNEDGIVAAANVIEARGLAGKVAVFGVGMDPRIAEQMVGGAGVIKYTTGQDAVAWGRDGMKLILAHFGGRQVQFMNFSETASYATDDLSSVRSYLDSHGQ